MTPTARKVVFAHAAILISAVVFTTVCPCGRTPGAFLFGDVVPDSVANWSFTNDVPLCQLEVRTWSPHSINLNCMAGADGNLYVSCSSCAGKSWSQTALVTGEGRIRMHRTVYPVSLRRVTDSKELDKAWAARLTKLKRAPEPRPDHWWSFHLTSR